MDSSVSPKDEIWFLRVCHHISNAVYLLFSVDDCLACRVEWSSWWWAYSRLKCVETDKYAFTKNKFNTKLVLFTRRILTLSRFFCYQNAERNNNNNKKNNKEIKRDILVSTNFIRPPFRGVWKHSWSEVERNSIVRRHFLCSYLSSFLFPFVFLAAFLSECWFFCSNVHIPRPHPTHFTVHIYLSTRKCSTNLARDFASPFTAPWRFDKYHAAAVNRNKQN
jgi:hypothetical protein